VHEYNLRADLLLDRILVFSVVYRAARATVRKPKKPKHFF